MFGTNLGISTKFQDQKINTTQVVDQNVTSPLPWENNKIIKLKRNVYMKQTKDRFLPNFHQL